MESSSQKWNTQYSSRNDSFFKPRNKQEVQYIWNNIQIYTLLSKRLVYHYEYAYPICTATICYNTNGCWNLNLTENEKLERKKALAVLVRWTIDSWQYTNVQIFIVVQVLLLTTRFYFAILCTDTSPNKTETLKRSINQGITRSALLGTSFTSNSGYTTKMQSHWREHLPEISSLNSKALRIAGAKQFFDIFKGNPHILIHTQHGFYHFSILRERLTATIDPLHEA